MSVAFSFEQVRDAEDEPAGSQGPAARSLEPLHRGRSSRGEGLGEACGEVRADGRGERYAAILIALLVVTPALSFEPLLDRDVAPLDFELQARGGLLAVALALPGADLATSGHVEVPQSGTLGTREVHAPASVPALGSPLPGPENAPCAWPIPHTKRRRWITH
mmetsp:Transcript_101235/g.286901  ORF Transcript_101235/g.286901 Transcript_101235/m.286901 type:complete len:163 (-) Transcript_101235:37-525(-)